jgi:hypothetical protein
MPVFFAFSDESGKYKSERSDKFILKNPFYCRSAILVEAQEWLKLKKEFFLLKRRLLNLGYGQEVKWSYIWSLYRHFQKKKAVPREKPYYHLRLHPLDSLVEFIRQALGLLKGCSSCRLCFTVTFNERQRTKPLEIKKVMALHMSHILALIEKEMEKIPESYCVFFLNREDPTAEKNLKDIFSEILEEAFPQKYPRVKDRLNFEFFPQSFGGQLADYYAGVINGCLRLYPQSIDLFRHQVWPRIVKENGQALGSGIKEIPENKKNRAFLQGILENIFKAKEKDYRVSIEERLRSKH